ncbi:urease accessory protein [Puccinia sorghi]|uniref:Urease accessory protein n=1 Tax=Puccinia sorghi TaxID=27349 RepID=A0A0L6UP52_9BASI|nr:urease accessory protein [Puccinia sorghi]
MWLLQPCAAARKAELLSRFLPVQLIHLSHLLSDSHEHLDHPGKFLERDLPDYSGRDWGERAFTIGIGGPVGSGKTALTLALCEKLRDRFNLGSVNSEEIDGTDVDRVLTNDIFIPEDRDFLQTHHALPNPAQIVAIETGGCPHAAIREDVSANLAALETLQTKYNCDLLLVESGGDNLAANYSRELADYIIYVIDVAGGDKIPRKGGPGISQSDLLVVNKASNAFFSFFFSLTRQLSEPFSTPHVGASLEVMRRDSDIMRDGGATVFTAVKHGTGVDAVVSLILAAWEASGAKKIRPE